MYWSLESTTKKRSPIDALRIHIFWLIFNLFIFLGIEFRVSICLHLQNWTKNTIHLIFDKTSIYVTNFMQSFRNIADFMHQTTELNNLRIENKKLHSQIDHLNQLAQENAALHNILTKTKSALPYQALSKVILSSTHPYLRSLLIEATDQHFVPGQAVTDDGGLIGYITHVESSFASVKIINDINAHTPVAIGTSQGILTGSQTGDLIIQLIDQIDTIKVGDSVVTISDGAHIPSDIAVGTVISIKDDYVHVKPSANLHPVFVMVLPKIQ